jgi:hypothetical protein
MSDSDEEFNDESLWETELEIALLTKCDYGSIRNITKLRPIPDLLRSKVWRICLDTQQGIEDNSISKWKEVYDLPQQPKIRQDCQTLAAKLEPNDLEAQIQIVSQLESIITYYCVSNDESYEKDNGWIEILQPIMSMKLSKNENYNFFSSILNRYIPKDCVQNGSPYHLFRLLMLYHDPEICAILDTRKVSPDSYAHLWFRSLFSANTDLKVVLNLWDIYFQLGDQFLVFFMSLILVFNSKEAILGSVDLDKSDFIKLIQNAPSTIDVEDLNDFNSLCQHYATKTPQSFRKEYKKSLFDGESLERKASSIYQALCLPVSVDELLQANQLGSGVRYFIIDCRPAEKYNMSHYATAFHLDANLMLENPTEFKQSVEALLDAQKQAINSGSVAGGQHLCFMGSGHDDEDKYVNMVVSNFLKNNINYVSLALGGYEELKQTIDDPEMIVGNEFQTDSRKKFTEDWIKKINNNNTNGNNSSESMMNKFSNVFKSKSFVFKDKLKDYISTSISGPTNTSPSNSNCSSNATTTTNISNANSKKQQQQQAKHVSSSDKIGKLYRNQGNLFAIDDEANDDQNDGLQREGGDQQKKVEYVNLKAWIEKPDTLNKFKCYYREKKSTNKSEWIPGYLLLTKTHLFGLTNKTNRKDGMYELAVRHPLSSIIKIATKSSCPEMISFTYGEKLIKSSKKNATNQSLEKITASTTTVKPNDETSSIASSTNTAKKEENTNIENEYDIKGKDWFFVQDYAGEAASAVKIQCLHILDLISQ